MKEYLADFERTLPPGYGISYTGEQEDQQESFSFLTTALLVGVAADLLHPHCPSSTRFHRRCSS